MTRVSPWAVSWNCMSEDGMEIKKIYFKILKLWKRDVIRMYVVHQRTPAFVASFRSKRLFHDDGYDMPDSIILRSVIKNCKVLFQALFHLHSSIRRSRHPVFYLITYSCSSNMSTRRTQKRSFQKKVHERRTIYQTYFARATSQRKKRRKLLQKTHRPLHLHQMHWILLLNNILKTTT